MKVEIENMGMPENCANCPCLSVKSGGWNVEPLRD